MYSKTSEKVREYYPVYLLLIVFALMVIRYLPIDNLQSKQAVKPSYNLSRIDWSIQLPKSIEAEITMHAVRMVNFYREQQALQQAEQRRALTPEAQINSYIDEIVAEYYPELDKTVIQAIVYNESHYIPEAVNSSSGTMGLMQISPKWHTERAANLGVTDLLDAYGNILVGCDILAEVTRQSGSFTYAMDVFAGGYAYANSYIGSVSPTRAHILETVSMINNGVINF